MRRSLNVVGALLSTHSLPTRRTAPDRTQLGQRTADGGLVNASLLGSSVGGQAFDQNEAAGLNSEVISVDEGEGQSEQQAHMMSAPIAQHLSTRDWLRITQERDSLRAQLAEERDEHRATIYEASLLRAEIERLRGGKDVQTRADGAVGDVRGDVRLSGAQGLLATANPLDHRLGLGPQPAEPVEPMSATSWKRRMG